MRLRIVEEWHEQRDAARIPQISQQMRREVAVRSRKRFYERQTKRGSFRFWVLAVSLVTTAVLVTAAMFATLYYLLS